MRNGMLHVRHMLEQLVQQNRQCMKLVEKQRSLIKSKPSAKFTRPWLVPFPLNINCQCVSCVGHFSECLLSVEEQYKQLIEQQQLLSVRLSSSHLQVRHFQPLTMYMSSHTQLNPMLDIKHSSVTEGSHHSQ